MKVEIPNPCHENWAQMSPTERGRFCASCKMEVIDFSRFSDAELQDFLRKPQNQRNTCGKFRRDQLDRPLLALPTQTRKRPSTWWLSLLLLVGACEKNTTSDNVPFREEVTGKVEAREIGEETPKYQPVHIRGVILAEGANTPLPTVGVRLGKDGQILAYTNARGEFELMAEIKPADYIEIVCERADYLPQTHRISWQDANQKQTIRLTEDEEQNYRKGEYDIRR